jgi:hypothetical protein
MLNEGLTHEVLSLRVKNSQATRSILHQWIYADGSQRLAYA